MDTEMGKQASWRSLSFNLTINIAQSVLKQVLETKIMVVMLIHSNQSNHSLYKVFKKLIYTQAWVEGWSWVGWQMQQLSQELSGEVGQPAGEEGASEGVGQDTGHYNQQDQHQRYFFWRHLQAVENLSSLLSTCIRLSLIGYQGKMEEMLRPSLSTRSTQVEQCFAKTFNRQPKLVLGLF